MTFAAILAGVFAVATAILTAIMKVYRIGPFLDREDMPSIDNETHIDIVSNEALKPDLSTNENTMKPQPSTPITPVLEANKPTLEEVCTYMRDFEGKPGDANYRNNNPLNCKFYDPRQTGTDIEYLPKYRPVKCSPSGFAKFKDYDTGWKYGVAMIRNKIKNHPNWTLLDLIQDHAPASDNNPVLIYTDNVAKRAGVDKSFKVINLI